MATIAVSGQVQLTDETGRFIAAAEEAARAATREMVETAAHFAAEGAPVGPPRIDYGRRPKLSTHVKPVLTSPKQGRVVADTGHGLAQELGAGPHLIPNAFGRGGAVEHPGNAPQPYIRPAIARLRALVPEIIKRAYARLG